MKWLRLACLVAAGLAWPAAASAHDLPFSYLDLYLEPTSIRAELVVHVFDVAQDLQIERPTDLLAPGAALQQANRIISFLEPRIRLAADGAPLAARWSAPEPFPTRGEVLQLKIHYELSQPTAAVNVNACLFPYDPVHQTFVNVHEDGHLSTQAVLTCQRPSFDYFTGTRRGAVAVAKKLLPAGLLHVLIAPEHWIFLLGLVLLGGPVRKLVVAVSVFTIAHTVALALAAFNLFTPPAPIVEPALALGIIYIGADNLLVSGGRDARPWIALAFGLIHGFSFAFPLRDMHLSSGALQWSLFAFNLGLEIGQVAVIVPGALAIAALRRRSEASSRRLVLVGSLTVMAAGAFWFVQRVFAR